MTNNWKFVLKSNLLYEEVEGRKHSWHSHPEINSEAETYMVKVVIKPGEGHDFHVHPEMHEILYVLEGKAEQWIEDERKILQKGESVYINAAVVHATFNAGDTDLEFLAILSPSGGWEAGTVDVSGEKPYSAYR